MQSARGPAGRARGRETNKTEQVRRPERPAQVEFHSRSGRPSAGQLQIGASTTPRAPTSRRPFAPAGALATSRLCWLRAAASPANWRANWRRRSINKLAGRHDESRELASSLAARYEKSTRAPLPGRPIFRRRSSCLSIKRHRASRAGASLGAPPPLAAHRSKRAPTHSSAWLNYRGQTAASQLGAIARVPCCAGDVCPPRRPPDAKVTQRASINLSHVARARWPVCVFAGARRRNKAIKVTRLFARARPACAGATRARVA